MILPAHTPYDRQLVFEHLEASAKRHRQVELSASGRHWRISVASARQCCAECARPLPELAYRTNGRIFCGHCARRALN